MSFSQLTRKSITSLPSSSLTRASGVPVTRGLNLAAVAGHSAHGGDHGHESAGPRKSFKDVPKWATEIGGMRATTRVNAQVTTRTRFMHTSSTSLRATTQIPDYSKNLKDNTESANRTYSYFMVGSMGLLTAAGAKSLVSDFLTNMSASSDVLALAKVEVDLGEIPEGKNVIIKWRGKPVFIRHRTSGEIEEANQVDIKSLRDPQKDSDRVQKPEWLVMLGVCTHLGCVPIGEAGDYGGWYCPCHGSHYDISGRVRRGPAPLNLEVPEYSFEEGSEKMIIG